jgi:hypothetical protein
MPSQSDSDVNPMLIFIPDISGFSTFVSNTDVAHSQHIIEELLETIINANEIGLEVSEIEGDAVLFYKAGEMTGIKELLQQVESIYSKFHMHLKLYEHTRICQCGACSSANNLKLKFVINYGDVRFNEIKGHVKLFGKEVIVSHRLMKNEVPPEEYVLFTNNVITDEKVRAEVDSLGWDRLKQNKQEYDIGTIEYQYMTLEPLSERIPVPQIESYGLKGAKTKISESNVIIEAPINMVFDVLSDYSIRHLWSPRIKDSDKLNGKISRNGSTHRCLINDNKFDPFFVAHDFNNSAGRIVFTETDLRVGISVIYELTMVDSETTKLCTHTFVSGKYLKPLIFNLFLKRRFEVAGRESNTMLNNYCLELLREGLTPKTQIVLN